MNDSMNCWSHDSHMTVMNVCENSCGVFCCSLCMGIDEAYIYSENVQKQ